MEVTQVECTAKRNSIGTMISVTDRDDWPERLALVVAAADVAELYVKC